MNIYDLLMDILAEVLSLTEDTLDNWVNVPANAAGPLDSNITLTAVGSGLVESLAKLAVSLGDFLSNIVQALF